MRCGEMNLVFFLLGLSIGYAVALILVIFMINKRENWENENN